MLKKKSNQVVVCLGEDVLRAVQLQGMGSSTKVMHLVSKPVVGLEGDKLVKFVSSALKKFDTKKSDVAVVIPSSMVITKNIEIPSTEESEIESIVSLQAGRHTPFSREEIQIGYINLGVFKSNYTKVLLVIGNRSLLKKQLEVLEKSGLMVKNVLFAPEGMASFYTDALGLSGNTAPTGIIDIGQQATEFIIAFNGKTVTTRNIPVGRSHLSSEGDAAKDKLVEELGKTLESYQTEDIEAVPGNYVLVNDDSSLADFLLAIKEKLNWNIETSSYIDQVKSSSGILKLLVGEYQEQSFFDVIAAGATINPKGINLIPDDLQIQKSVEEQGREVFKLAKRSLILLVLVAVILGSKIYFKNTYLMNLENQYKDNQKEALFLQDISSRMRVVQNYLKGRMISLDAVNELYEKIPREVYLTSIVLDDENNVNIQGISEMASIVFNLGTTLKESDLFKSVDIKSTTSKKIQGKDVSAFEIVLGLNEPADQESDDSIKVEE